MDYLDNLNPIIKDYFKILSNEFPKFLFDYINTPRMQKQAGISVSCGTYYSKMFDSSLWYSSLDHSIAVALIIWHFTHDKKQALAGLFHDISTPVFKHCIDFMNNDYENQESTEDLTKKMILESTEIMKLLKRDNININEVADYHIYPIADNDTPMLSADRLEYTLSNGLGQVKKIWDLDDIQKLYKDITLVTNEFGNIEMCFNTLSTALKFTKAMSILSICYINDKDRFSMQFLADIIKIMFEHNLIKVEDLYNLSEKEVIAKINNCHDFNIKEAFRIWQTSDSVFVSEKKPINKYCVKVNAKKRYINPLVKTNNGIKRISDISLIAKEQIQSILDCTFNRYVYMNFNLDNKSKIKKIK